MIMRICYLLCVDCKIPGQWAWKNSIIIRLCCKKKILDFIFDIQYSQFFIILWSLSVMFTLLESSQVWKEDWYFVRSFSKYTSLIKILNFKKWKFPPTFPRKSKTFPSTLLTLLSTSSPHPPFQFLPKTSKHKVKWWKHVLGL